MKTLAVTGFLALLFSVSDCGSSERPRRTPSAESAKILLGFLHGRRGLVRQRDRLAFKRGDDGRVQIHPCIESGELRAFEQ
jgi:hypothetical protein